MIPTQAVPYFPFKPEPSRVASFKFTGRPCILALSLRRSPLSPPLVHVANTSHLKLKAYPELLTPHRLGPRCQIANFIGPCSVLPLLDDATMAFPRPLQPDDTIVDPLDVIRFSDSVPKPLLQYEIQIQGRKERERALSGRETADVRTISLELGDIFTARGTGVIRRRAAQCATPSLMLIFPDGPQAI